MAFSDNELFDIRDAEGRPTGEVKARALVHRDGDLHGASHIFIFRRGRDGMEVLLQRRSPGKDSFPNCLDTSSAGHLDAGDTFEEAAYRELEEELGVRRKDLPSDGLQFLFFYHHEYQAQFNGRLFHDNEIEAVYAVELDRPAEWFRVEEAEIQEVVWMPVREVAERLSISNDELLQRIEAGTEEICIVPEEFQLCLQCFKPRI